MYAYVCVCNRLSLIIIKRIMPIIMGVTVKLFNVNWRHSASKSISRYQNLPYIKGNFFFSVCTRVYIILHNIVVLYTCIHINMYAHIYIHISICIISNSNGRYGIHTLCLCKFDSPMYNIYLDFLVSFIFWLAILTI